MKEWINQNGDCSNSHHNQRWWMNHQNQKSKSKSRRNPEEGGKERSRGKERDDPVAAKGSRRRDPIAGGCWGAQGSKPGIATRQLTRVPLIAPASCWTPFLVFVGCFYGELKPKLEWVLLILGFGFGWSNILKVSFCFGWLGWILPIDLVVL